VKKKSTSDMVYLGLAIQAKKDELPHGEFLSWLDRNLDESRRSAQRYMHIARQAVRVVDAVRKS